MSKNQYEAIVIYRKDDSTVIAVDKRNGNTASAKCSPSDKFDLLTGAKIALDRLPAHKFKIGDKVIGNKDANRYAVTCEGVILTVVDNDYHGIFATKEHGCIRVKVDSTNSIYTVLEECFDHYDDTIKSEGFKEGDYVIGTDSSKYPITGKGVVCKVVNPYTYTGCCGEYMKVMVVDSRYYGYKFDVLPEYFTLYDKTKGEEMERKNRPIEAGDVVSVKDTGSCYSCDTNFVCKNAPNNDIIARFVYGVGLGYPEKKKLPNEFKVIAINDDRGIDKAIIEEPISHKVYVIGVDGLSHE